MLGRKKTETVTSYKGFNPGLSCQPDPSLPKFQYEIGKTYKHKGKVQACATGFHACEYPLDVFGYYAPATSEFAIVEQSGELARHADDSKIASSVITIKGKLTIAGLVKAAIDFTFSRSKPEGLTATGDRGAASATGYQGAASATGYQGAASATGYRGAASATGDQGAGFTAGARGGGFG